jgi:hypothetical protein
MSPSYLIPLGFAINYSRDIPGIAETMENCELTKRLELIMGDLCRVLFRLVLISPHHFFAPSK